MIANYRQALPIEEREPEPSVYFISYIQSSGTQYIDTGFNPNQNTRVVMDVELYSQPNSMAAIFGERQKSASNDSRSFILWSSNQGKGIRSDFMGNNVSSAIALLGKRVEVDKNRNVCHIGDETVTNSSGSGQALGSLWLFAVNNVESGTLNTSWTASVKCYSCQIYDNDVLVRDYAPALDPEGVPCLYDKISEEYVYNSGTGSFTAPS